MLVSQLLIKNISVFYHLSISPGVLGFTHTHSGKYECWKYLGVGVMNVVEGKRLKGQCIFLVPAYVVTIFPGVKNVKTKLD